MDIPHHPHLPVRSVIFVSFFFLLRCIVCVQGSSLVDGPVDIRETFLGHEFFERISDKEIMTRKNVRKIYQPIDMTNPCVASR